MERSESVGSISVDDFTEATFKAVLRAFDAHKEQRAVGPELLPGPIVYGIIFWPEGGPPGTGPPFGPGAERAE